MAEGVGFEPTVGCPTLDFESSALNRTQPSLRFTPIWERRILRGDGPIFNQDSAILQCGGIRLIWTFVLRLYSSISEDRLNPRAGGRL